MEHGTKLLKTWCLNSQKPFIQCSVLPVSLKEENYEAKRRGRRLSVHCNGSEKNVELILRMIISANQLGVYGAAADMCREVSEDTMGQRRRNQLQEYEQQFEQLSDNQKLSKLCSERWFENCRKRTIFHHTWCRRTERNGTFMPRIYAAS